MLVSVNGIHDSRHSSFQVFPESAVFCGKRSKAVVTKRQTEAVPVMVRSDALHSISELAERISTEVKLRIRSYTLNERGL